MYLGVNPSIILWSFSAIITACLVGHPVLLACGTLNKHGLMRATEPTLLADNHYPRSLAASRHFVQDSLSDSMYMASEGVPRQISLPKRKALCKQTWALRLNDPLLLFADPRVVLPRLLQNAEVAFMNVRHSHSRVRYEVEKHSLASAKRRTILTHKSTAQYHRSWHPVVQHQPMWSA